MLYWRVLCEHCEPGGTGGIQINGAMIAMNTFITVSQPTPSPESRPALSIYVGSDRSEVSVQFRIFIINILVHPGGRTEARKGCHATNGALTQLSSR